MAERVIEIRGLRKSYGDVEAVRGIDLHVDHGEVFALLGPNGAGKTTTVEILEGYRERTDGEVSVLGQDPRTPGRPQGRVGIVLQSTGVDPVPHGAGDGRPLRRLLPLAPGHRRGDRPRRPRREANDPREASSRAASSGGWTSRSRSPATRSCCSSTSRRPASTRTRARRLGDREEPRGHREDDLPHDPLHGRGPVPRRPGRGDRQGRDRRGRHAEHHRRTRPDADTDPTSAFPTANAPRSSSPTRRRSRTDRGRSGRTTRRRSSTT